MYSLTGTYDPTTNEVVVTWNRPPDENDVNHEVRYAFSDIHEVGWEAATPPEGIIRPPQAGRATTGCSTIRPRFRWRAAGRLYRHQA